MAAKLDNGGDDLDELHEINVTPFIDVVLVLLIVFMVAAPLATVDVAVDLPSSTAAASPRPQKPIFVTLRADLTLAVGENAVPRADLQRALLEETAANREQRVFLRADRSVDYGAVMEVMNLLRDAGYLKVALVGLADVPPQPPESAQRP